MFNRVLDLCGYLAILHQNLGYSRDGSAGSDDAETESSDGKPEDAEERKRRRRQYNPLPDYTEWSKKDIRDGKMPLKLLSPRYLAKVYRKVNIGGGRGYRCTSGDYAHGLPYMEQNGPSITRPTI